MSSLNANFDDSQVDVELPFEDGYPPDKAAGDTTENLRGLMGSRDFSNELWIEPSEWKEKAAYNDEHGLWAENLKNRFTNQNPTHECTCHSLVQGFEAAWNAVRAGKGSPVLVSQISIYAEANPRQRGGAGCIQVLNIAMERGFIPEPCGMNGRDEQAQMFKHTLHGTCGKGNQYNANGNWVAVRDFPEGWKETARHFRPTEVIVCSSVEEIICCLLHSRVVNVGRSGHAVPYNQVLWRGGNDRDPLNGIHAQYSDSYDVLRYDSLKMIRSAVGGSSCIWQTTVPDDWSKPAGEDMKT